MRSFARGRWFDINSIKPSSAEIKIIFHYNEILVWLECALRVWCRSDKPSWERTLRWENLWFLWTFIIQIYSGMWNLLQLIVSLCFVCSLNPFASIISRQTLKTRSNTIKLTIKTALKTSRNNTTIDKKRVSLWKGNRTMESEWRTRREWKRV